MKTWTFRRKRNIALLVAFWLMSVSVVLGLRLIQTPNHGTVIKYDNSVEALDLGDLSAKSSTLNGKHFSLVYDNGYSDITDISRDDVNALEQYRLHKPGQTGGTSIVISIRRLPAGGLKEDASYRLRKLKTAEYIESNVSVGSSTAALMREVKDQEVVAFLIHDRLLATIAVIGEQPGTEITPLTMNMLQALQWRN